MKTEYLLGKEARDHIKDTFSLMRSLIAPTMGARGRFAILDQEMGQPLLTDDGVTVARNLADLGGYNRTIGKAFIEACNATEKEAFDGTTLTAVLIDELYKIGYDWIEEGMHPQVAAQKIEEGTGAVVKALMDETIPMKPKYVENIGLITTKIPQMGDIMRQVYDLVGKEMNASVQWRRDMDGYSVKHEEGLVLHSGYMSDDLKRLGKFFPKAKIALLRTGLQTDLLLKHWFDSFPAVLEEVEIEGEIHQVPRSTADPIIYVITPKFNPEALRKLIEVHDSNQLAYQFIFINESQADQLYMDIAATTGGKIQDTTSGIKEYTYKMCGDATKVSVGIAKSMMFGEGDVSGRVEYYTETLEKSKFEGDQHERFLMETRLAGLTTGVAVIMIGVPTQAAFIPLKLKCDDALGAVKMSFEQGIVLGAGKTLYNIATQVPELATALKAGHNQILENAGIKGNKLVAPTNGYDVTTRKVVNLKSAGILDSYSSIYRALINSSSIVTNYLKSYMISKRKED